MYVSLNYIYFQNLSILQKRYLFYNQITEIETLWCKSADWLPPLGKLPNYANGHDHPILSHVTKFLCRKTSNDNDNEKIILGSDQKVIQNKLMWPST